MGQEHQKRAKSPKLCKIAPRLLWRTNRKSHTRCRLAPKRHSGTVVFRNPPEKFEWRYTQTVSGKLYRPWL